MFIISKSLSSIRFMLCNILTIGIDMGSRRPLRPRYKRRRIVEQVIHIFQVQSFCLGQESPEEQSTCQIAYNENDVESPANS